MAAPTVEQLVTMLTTNGQADAARWLQANPTANVGAWGYGQPTPVTQIVSGMGPPPPPGYLASLSAGAKNPNAAAVVDANGRATTPLVPGGLNVPYGSDYYAPALDSWTRLALARMQQEQAQAQLGQQNQQFYTTAGLQNSQFNTSALMNAAQALAGLYAHGPKSAAELAFANAGMGFPAIGGNAAAIEALIRASTQGGSNPDGTLDFGNGQRVSIPSTLGGRALLRLQADPNLAGVIDSFAKAAGNPDLIARSSAAALPGGFPMRPFYSRPVESGLGL